MKQSTAATEILDQITDKTKLGDLRKLAKEIKKDHALALELWGEGSFLPRMLAVLIMDSKLLTQEVIDQLDMGMQKHPKAERNQLVDWLMANQILKDKKATALIAGWENSPSALQRRIFWYRQGRLRWMGQKSPEDTGYLLAVIEDKIEKEVPEVQWAMNFLAGWIGVFDKQYRKRCIAIGERTGLYKDEMVSKGCTPNYLPEFIAIESGKRNL